MWQKAKNAASGQAEPHTQPPTPRRSHLSDPLLAHQLDCRIICPPPLTHPSHLYLCLCLSVFLHSEDAQGGELLVVEYSVKPVGGTCHVRLLDPQQSIAYQKDARIDTDDETIRAGHTASRSGEHRLCFTNREARQQLTVDVQYRVGGVGGRQGVGGEVAKKEALKPMESKLQQLETTVLQIANEMKALQGKEAEMTAIRDSTSSRIVWFSISTTLLLLLLKGAEIVYLRQYFKSRRMIQ